MKIDFSIITCPAHGKVVSEDAHKIVHETGKPFFVTVVDGHGPQNKEFNDVIAEFAEYVAGNMTDLFRRYPKHDRFGELFDIVQQDVALTYGNFPFGAVASCLCIDGFGLTIAQAGDCRLYQFTPQNEYGHECLTQDHGLYNMQEINRLRPFFQSGQFAPLSYGPMNRVSGLSEERLHFKQPNGQWSSWSLSPTRGFGDPEFHPAFTHVPEVRTVSYSSHEDCVFALCSDGGTCIVQETFKFMKIHATVLDDEFLGHATAVARAIVPERPHDDITIILIRIRPNSLPTSL